MASLTQERLKNVLRYDPDTGVFVWLIHTRRTRPGQTAGSACADGYIEIGIDRERFRAHRLAWFYMTGEWPTNLVDHKNMDRMDNSWTNLRLSDSSLNQQNQRRASRNSKTGLLGVSPYKGGRFQASITINRRQINLGNFDTPLRAYEVYLAAKRKLHPANTL